mmetsp:Transcript_24111/g.48995  ORF Transcript_24111/g.48995 Transcript_24111/m.48995 type:complete len:275 (+) Transcript_24111:3326-4150(+)
MLHRTLHEARLLAKHADARLVVLREHVVGHDGVRHLRRSHQVHLEQTGLQRALLLLVALKHVEQERRGLLQAIVLHEDVRHDIEVERHALGRSELLRKLQRACRVDAHDIGEQETPIGGILDLLAIDHDLVKLARLHETLDDLGMRGGFRAQVDGECELLVHHLDVVAELLGALELVLPDPLLQELLLALLDNGLGQLQRLLRVEFTLLQKHAKVGEDGRRLPGRGRGLLEALNRVGRPQGLLWRLCGELSGALVVALVHQVVELLHEELLGAG